MFLSDAYYIFFLVFYGDVLKNVPIYGSLVMKLNNFDASMLSIFFVRAFA